MPCKVWTENLLILIIIMLDPPRLLSPKLPRGKREIMWLECWSLSWQIATLPSLILTVLLHIQMQCIQFVMWPQHTTWLKYHMTIWVGAPSGISLSQQVRWHHMTTYLNCHVMLWVRAPYGKPPPYQIWWQ